MSIFNFTFGNKRTPSQLDLGRTGSSVNHFYDTGIGYTIDEFNLYSQIKDYRTDLLNGTNWRATDMVNATNFQYIQFLKILSKNPRLNRIHLCKDRRIPHIRRIQGFRIIVCGKSGHKTIGRRMMWQKESALLIRRSQKWREGVSARKKGGHY